MMGNGEIRFYFISFANADTKRAKIDMRQLQMFQKIEYVGEPIFKVVLEC